MTATYLLVNACGGKEAVRKKRGGITGYVPEIINYYKIKNGEHYSS